MPRRRAYSLIELTVASAMAGVLLVAVASAVVLASHALPTRDGAAVRAAEAGRVYERLSTELGYAIAVIEREADAVTLLLAPRPGEADPRRVRWAWGGSAGDALTRQVGDADAVTILTDVAAFELTYESQSVSWTYPGPAVLTPFPVKIASSTPSGLIGSLLPQTWTVTQQRWIGQYVLADLEADVIGWRPTTATVHVAPNLLGLANLEDTLVEVRPANLHRMPQGSALTAGVLKSSQIPTVAAAERSIAFGDEAQLLRGQAVTLVLARPPSGGDAATVTYHPAAGLRDRVFTLSGEGGWNYDDSAELRYELYGIPMMRGPTQTASREYLHRVRVQLDPGGDSLRSLHGGVSLPTRPAVLTGVWELDFTRNPRLVDFNGDGTRDWEVATGEGFRMSQLTGGIWYADQEIRAEPVMTFNELTEIHVRMRHASNDSTLGPAVRIHAHWSGGQTAPLDAYVYGDGVRQRFVLENGPAGQLVDVADLPLLDFVDVRLLIDPAYGTVNVRINGEDRGSYTYQRTGTVGLSPGLTLRGRENHPSAEFAFARVRVGGGP
ncbi:MAG: hypothetical protein WD009_12460 [Phycisphaeraceae bacterium]